MTPGHMGPPVPHYGGRPPVPPLGGIRPRMPPPPMHGPMPGPMHGTMMRQWMPPPGGPMRPGMMPPRPPMMFGPRGPGGPRPPMWHPMAPRHMMGPGMRPRGMMPNRMPPHIRARFPNHNHNGLKIKSANSAKKSNKMEEMALKKPWMTDEIRSEIEKKNKLYAKARQNKDAKEWEEFKDLRNKVTRMIRDAKNEYNAKNPNKGDDEDEELEDEEEEEEKEEEMGEEEGDWEESNFENIPDDMAYWDYSEEVESEGPAKEAECHYCENCDRDFPSEERLQEHISMHEICGIDGCTFTAHPKLIEKHYSMQHATGLYQRMKSSAEDIQKYLSERQKRWPSTANIQKKLEEQLEKTERGEVIELETITKNKRENNRLRQKDRKRKNRKRPKRQQEVPKANPECMNKGLKMFQGTGTLPVLEDIEIVHSKDEDNDEEQVGKEEKESRSNVWMTDEEDEQGTSADPPQNAPPLLNALSLLAGYGSDSDDDEPPEELPVKIMKLNELKIEESNQNASKAELAPDIPNIPTENNKEKVFKSKTKVRVTQSKKTQTVKREQINNAQQQCNDRSVQFLRKLLARDIQEERNTVFQCIKYIVDNNFFDDR